MMLTAQNPSFYFLCKSTTWVAPGNSKKNEFQFGKTEQTHSMWLVRQPRGWLWGYGRASYFTSRNLANSQQTYVSGLWWHSVKKNKTIIRVRLFVLPLGTETPGNWSQNHHHKRVISFPPLCENDAAGCLCLPGERGAEQQTRGCHLAFQLPKPTGDTGEAWLAQISSDSSP